MPNETTPDFAALKARMKATWMAGDFGQVAKYAEHEAVKFISHQNIKPGMRVLDVACGTGNLAIPAAKAGATVTGVDIASNLVEQARERAKSANWTPAGFIGHMFKITSHHLPPPPPGAPIPPVLWGDAATVRERFRDGVSKLVLTPVMAQLRYPFSVPETIEFFRTYYGPTQMAFGALSEDRQPALRRDMENLFRQNNKATDGTTCVEAEYLEVVATRA